MRSILLASLLLLGFAQAEATAISMVGVRIGEHPRVLDDGQFVRDAGGQERRATVAIVSTASAGTVGAAVAATSIAAAPAVMRNLEGPSPVVLAQLGTPTTGLPVGPLSPQRAPAAARGQAQAQQAQAPAAETPTAGAAPAVAATPIRLEAGTGRLVTLPAPATTLMAADPRVVRVQPSSATSIFLMAGAPGRTTVIATNETGQPVAEFNITVVPGAGGSPAAAAPATGAATGRVAASAAAMEAQLRTLIPGPGQVRVRTVGEQIILSGTVPTAADSRRAEAIVRGMGAEEAEVLNELAVLASIQVNLRVRVAEITREVTRQFGFNWQALGQSGNFLFGVRTGAFIGAGAGGGGNLLNASGGRFAAGYSSGGWDANTLVDALAAENLVTILAEPNLTAQSGEVASFLAGGEFPIPVSAGSDGQIGIEFKSFGVSLAFVPVVLANDRLTLRVRPEVSELSEQGAISIPISNVGVIRIPALSVRRAETTIELGSGQSFAIAGLLQRSSLQGQEGVNGLVDIPILGALFRSDRFQRRETELVIIVTPYLVQPVSDPAALTAPTDIFRPATSLDRILTGRQVGGAPRSVPGVSPGLGFRLN